MAPWKLLAGAAVLATGAGAAGLALSAGSNNTAGAGQDTEPPAARKTVEVARRDLVRTNSYDGAIDYGEATPLTLAADGTLTGLPAVGDIVDNGATVAEVDGEPLIALTGAFPFWRELRTGAADGKDVLQLEYMLATLGYAQENGVTVDDEFTDATRRALKAFEADHGLDDDGVLQLGEIVVIAAPVRVSEVEGTLGERAAEAGITTTAATRTINASIPIADAGLFAPGGGVTVDLPDGSTIDGTIFAVGAAQTDGSGSTTVPVTIAADGIGELADNTPVEVNIEESAAKDVLAVPVEAVLALAEGGYAVEVQTAVDAPTRLVAVELGEFADGLVAITGDIEPGAQVVIP